MQLMIESIDGGCNLSVGNETQFLLGCDALTLANTLWNKPGTQYTDTEMVAFGFSKQQVSEEVSGTPVYDPAKPDTHTGIAGVLGQMSLEDIDELLQLARKQGKPVNTFVPSSPQGRAFLDDQFHCQRCNTCCHTGHKGIILTPAEAKLLQGQIEGHTVCCDGFTLLTYPCHFHVAGGSGDQNGQCRIYDIRPLVCRDYPFNGGAKLKGLPVLDGALILSAASDCPEALRIVKGIWHDLSLVSTKGLPPWADTVLSQESIDLARKAKIVGVPK